jgi:16S rRNA (guanine1207-N2)-methyltransferase
VFDTILLNPPQTAGKKLCFELIEESKAHLKKDGLLQLVARHNKGGKDLSKKMLEVFGNVEPTAKEAGFRVYVSKRLE